ncbi:MAG: hypothetical protein R2754_14390 [Microthrixaceae bacterium]
MCEEPGLGGASAPRLGWWRRLVGAFGAVGRTSGYPTSGNRASSMHLFWDLPGRFVEVSVTVTILDEPQTDDLYFWALQVGFEDAATGRREGAAHTGPQWAAQHPGHGAVNWGGYGADGELGGGPGFLPSASGNANSVDYPWLVGVPYRLTVSRAPSDGAHPATARARGGVAPPGYAAWRSTITPLAASPGDPFPQPQASQTIRDLWAPGDRLVSPMVWSEVFARCDAAPVRVSWSEPVGIDEAGVVHRCGAGTVNYQTAHDGGCSNTNATARFGELGPEWMQETATERTTPQGTRLALDPR